MLFTLKTDLNGSDEVWSNQWWVKQEIDSRTGNVTYPYPCTYIICVSGDDDVWAMVYWAMCHWWLK